jgi:hypothetical protein
MPRAWLRGGISVAEAQALREFSKINLLGEGGTAEGVCVRPILVHNPIDGPLRNCRIHAQTGYTDTRSLTTEIAHGNSKKAKPLSKTVACLQRTEFDVPWIRRAPALCCSHVWLP